MAIYHLSAKVITRAKGQSVIACAAYRAGEKLNDERHGEIYDYTKKQDIAHSEILLPDNAPQWMRDRGKLWNAVEQSEKRKDSQLAREVQVALPRELTLSQNIELTREFVTNQFVSQGMVADFNIHVDKASDGDLQPHAHILLTMREIKAEGFGQKVREWNDKSNLQQWREQWAEYTNKHLALNGHDIVVDHRSLAEQGIDLEPQKKIGATTAFGRMAGYQDHIERATRNGEHLLEHPEIVLDVLTRQQSTFTHQDIARIVSRYTGDAEQFQSVYEKVKALPELVSLGVDDKNRQRYSTQGMVQLESEMVQNATGLESKQGHSIDDVSINAVASKHGLSAEQGGVLEHLVTGGDLRNVVGYAGTGKSRMLGAAKEIWEQSGYRVLGASLSGIAAENLEASSGISSRTLASRTYYWDRGQELLSSKDILVIDEAGMLGSRQMGGMLEEARKHGAKVVLIGDPEQLQAIDAGAAFRTITDKTSYLELTEIWRQQVGWQKEATIQLATKHTGDALAQYAKHDSIHEFDTQIQAKAALVDAWNDARIVNPDESQIMLAYTREAAKDLNQMARSLRQSLDELGEDHTIGTEKGQRQFALSDRIYFLKNDRELGVKNGTLGTILNIENCVTGKFMSVQLDKDDNGQPIIVSFPLCRYNQLDHGYAATIHKAQGVTVDRSYVLTSKYLDRHATYVAMTRHKEGAEIFWSKEEFPKYDKMVDCLSRERAKDSTLDYSAETEFAKYRGIMRDSNASLFSPYPDISDIDNKKADDSFKIPKGFEDLFTPDVVKKINDSKNCDYSDLLSERGKHTYADDNKSLGDKDIEL